MKEVQSQQWSSVYMYNNNYCAHIWMEYAIVLSTAVGERLNIDQVQQSYIDDTAHTV